MGFVQLYHFSFLKRGNLIFPQLCSKLQYRVMQGGKCSLGRGLNVM
jgi:hypothetical protein